MSFNKAKHTFTTQWVAFNDFIFVWNKGLCQTFEHQVIIMFPVEKVLWKPNPLSQSIKHFKQMFNFGSNVSFS